MPKNVYTGEDILKILFDPKIDKSKICLECPRQIVHSSTFVVDLDELKHPDDIKKDEFGKWNYSGSHVDVYRAWKHAESTSFEKVNSSSSDAELFQLR